MRKLVLSSIILMAVSTLNAANVFSENFEGATIGNYLSPNPVTGSLFSLTAGSADINGAGVGNYGWLCDGDVGQCLDTTGGGSGGRGTLETALLSFSVPGLYQLRLNISRWDESDQAAPNGGANDTILRIGVVGLTTADYTIDSTFVNGVYIQTFNVLAPTSAKLTIQDLGTVGSTGFAGGILDNITIDSIEGVPEPSTYALIGSGVAALLFARRKR